MVSAWYNENDPFAAEWLRGLIKAGAIAPGVVDERDIRDIAPNEFAGFTQCHFFAGIGGWSYALRLAGWPDDRPVWTGSCPCQPFSTAGKRAGIADERHLWPSWFWLIRECKPDVIFGEQVEAAIGQGWLDLVSTDLEGEGYAVGAEVLGAHSVGAPHRRQRAYFVAQSDQYKCGQVGADAGGFREGSRVQGLEQRSMRGGDEFVAHAERSEWGSGGILGRHETDETAGGGTPTQLTGDCEAGKLANAPDLRRLERRNAEGVEVQGERPERSGEYATTGHAGELSGGFEGLCGIDRAVVEPPGEQVGVSGLARESQSAGSGVGHANSAGSQGRRVPSAVGSGDGRDKCVAGETMPANFWSNAIWLPCRDGKLRPVERTTQPGPSALADGAAGDLGLVRVSHYPGHQDEEEEIYIYSPLIAKGRARVGRLRGYGNALCAPAAQAFVRAFMEVEAG